MQSTLILHNNNAKTYKKFVTFDPVENTWKKILNLKTILIIY